MSKQGFDIAIVGGGIVGLATAFQLQIRYPKLDIVVFEKEKQLAFHQTGRNSGVIHSGLYYKPGSLKAKNCFYGRTLLTDFSRDNKLDFDVCGKIVIATNLEEVSRLEKLKCNGERNGLQGLELLDPVEFQKIEPYSIGLKALWVPDSGIIDYKQVANKLAENVEQLNNNSRIITDCEVLDYKSGSIATSKGNFNANNIIFCGGLFADRLAAKDDINLDMQIVGFRGDYYRLSNLASSKVNKLI